MNEYENGHTDTRLNKGADQMTFADFLKQLGYEVVVGITDVGEIYVINGEQIFYRDLHRTKYKDLFVQYISKAV
ncbi:hypothetical protein [Halobacillus salinus]|uniref:hypothetical protein n=1 Tax=Halobacillus salinus TaxID=192814 RepID=UPI0009A791F2|nr:hypothetical protein [Halobacillus salinus]